jgi:hypothetical protein
MTVWTVSSTDAKSHEGVERCVVGTYTSRGAAIDNCVDYIIERLNIREDLAWSMKNDTWNRDACKFFSESRKGSEIRIKHGCVNRLRAYIRDALGGQGCYIVFDGLSTWRFDVDETGVEGMMWTVVTWGDSDTEDPNFTTPAADSFTSEESAINSFYWYAVNLKKDRGIPISEGFKPFVFDTLKTDHKVQIDLDDGCCISCVIYPTKLSEVVE